MVAQVPYCGVPPLPGALLTRFNLDPVLIAVLLVVASLHILLSPDRRTRRSAFCGWALAAAAWMSPLCALSVALFSARVAQHMVLILGAAPLLALGLPAAKHSHAGLRLWSACGAFFIALWFWHMPRPYDATFTSSAVYWAMHVTLFGSAVWLWREILQSRREHALEAVAAGAFTSMHMGLLGAVLTMAARPLFFWHLTTTQAWGFTPLEDQQLGGVFMWVPGIGLFLWAALRTLGRLRGALEEDVHTT